MTRPEFFYGTGRRKSAVARVRLYPGQGKNIIVNGKPLLEVFGFQNHSGRIMQPFAVTKTEEHFDASIKVLGGGVAGQAGAIRHGIARALLASDESLRRVLREYGLLTRDAREKERKKYGLIRARKRKQYTKR